MALDIKDAALNDILQETGREWLIRTKDFILSGCQLQTTGPKAPPPSLAFLLLVGPDGTHQWKPVDYKILLQLRSAIQSEGISGSGAQLMLDTIATSGKV